MKKTLVIKSMLRVFLFACSLTSIPSLNGEQVGNFIKFEANQPISYSFKGESVFKQNTNRGLAEILKCESTLNFQSAIYRNSTMAELSLQFQSLSASLKFAGITLSFDIANSPAKENDHYLHQILHYFMNQQLLIPITTDEQLLASASDKYWMMPVEDVQSYMQVSHYILACLDGKMIIEKGVKGNFVNDNGERFASLNYVVSDIDENTETILAMLEVGESKKKTKKNKLMEPSQKFKLRIQIDRLNGMIVQMKGISQSSCRLPEDVLQSLGLPTIQEKLEQETRFTITSHRP